VDAAIRAYEVDGMARGGSGEEQGEGAGHTEEMEEDEAMTAEAVDEAVQAHEAERGGEQESADARMEGEEEEDGGLDDSSDTDSVHER
tara:strand:- start:278 stop:541 length:264 start_codon:yes stop_codon:yes gene_type:complete